MQYLILIYDEERDWSGLSEEEANKAFGEWMAYSKEMALAGAMKGGASLQPIHTATTVRVRDGKTTTTDGPFAETKEQLGGYYVVDVPNLDEALKWAAKCPASRTGSIEVRPLGIISNDQGEVVTMQQ